MDRRLSAALSLFIIALWGCPGEGTGPGGNMAYCDTVSTVSFACDVQPIFSANCALSGCHAGPNPQQNMNLSEGQAYDNIVDVASLEVPRLFRIEPDNADSSYLIHKIQGTQNDVTGPGDIPGERMPLDASPLSQDLIDLIRAWVAAGAPDN